MEHVLEMIFVFFTLHCIADYPLQGDFLASFKGKNWFILFIHASIWSGVIYMGLMYYGIASPPKYLLLLLGHMMIDKWKCMREDKSKALTTDLYIDQVLHMVQLVVVTFHVGA